MLPDSRSLVRTLASMTFTPAKADSMYLITRDVEALYVNNPINVAVEVIGGSLFEVLSRGAIGARAATQATWLRRAMDIVFTTTFKRSGDRTGNYMGFPWVRLCLLMLPTCSRPSLRTCTVNGSMRKIY